MRSEMVLAGRYRLEERLGRGGMGEVWRGFDPHLQRSVAVKLIAGGGGDDEALIRRFQREARIAANIQHPGITAVHDFGRHDGQLFLVMELLRGRDLAALLADHPDGLPLDQVVSVATQAADALQAAHAHRVVHRDLKPGNLFLLDSGHVKICDFGIAHIADATSQLTAAGTALGTPAFMPPEQWKGEEVDAGSDVYAFGGVLHTMLTGSVPFTGTLPALMAQHLTQPPPPVRADRPDVPAELADLVARMMAKDPAERPASHDLSGLIRRAAGSSAATGASPTAAATPAPPPAAATPVPPHATAYPATGHSRPPSQPVHPGGTAAPAAGDPHTMFTLGLRHREQGDVAGAESWYRRAAEAGHLDSMFNLALLSRERGNMAEAESWYRRAAEAGDPDAMTNLGTLLKDRGEVAEAEQWHRRAAEAGHVASMHTLGNLLYGRGDAAEAEQWWCRAAEGGNIRAMGLLGNLLEQRGDAFGAEQWYRRAAESGHLDAMVNLGVLLENRRDLFGAEQWYHRAAEAGDIDAMVNLGSLLYDRGDVGGAEYWWRRAAQTGNTRAIHNLGRLG
ncbi:protein kinase [Thermobifida halotolerans]|uniref:non-specific serine/threonine protein kinase n=1 Tax=Thermobifida halotolerans TaxID=483545 RepID=A0AA97LZZ7_9ACTN|nr:serine/threonine-protein kinase [Thermobifida halotolerans]UOE20953.1 protein kinase [Thermobifida halotolerans]